MKLFISHATEDKTTIARPLADLLLLNGYEVWYDEYSLALGDSLMMKIQEGLTNCHFGIVILSHAFFGKKWTQNELDSLFTRETVNEKKILPVWHDIELEDVKKHSLMLAGRLAVPTSKGLDQVVESINKTTKWSPKARLKKAAIIKIYEQACEGEEWLARFCHDMVDKKDIAKDVLRNIDKVDLDRLKRIFKNLSYLFLKEDLKYLFFLVMYTYDRVHIDDSIVKRIKERNLKGLFDINKIFVPYEASHYVCDIFLNAFHKAVKLDPSTFLNLIKSPSFALYCITMAFEYTIEIINSWNAKIIDAYGAGQISKKEHSLDPIDLALDKDYKAFQIFIGDAVKSVVILIDLSTSTDVQSALRRFLKDWFKRNFLHQYLLSLGKDAALKFTNYL